MGKAVTVNREWHGRGDGFSGGAAHSRDRCPQALGATPGIIAKLVLFEAARWTLVGVAFGLLGSWFASQ